MLNYDQSVQECPSSVRINCATSDEKASIAKYKNILLTTIASMTMVLKLFTNYFPIKWSKLNLPGPANKMTKKQIRYTPAFSPSP